jgi:hypothetical protein
MSYTFIVFVPPVGGVFINFKIFQPSIFIYVQVQKKSEDKEVPKYAIRPPANLYSEFLLEMEVKKVHEKEEEQKKHEEERRLAIEVSVWQKVYFT